MTVRLTVRAKPRAKKSRLLKVDGLVADIALAAPPVDGAANEELVAFLAKLLGVPKRDIHLAVGAGSRTKLVDFPTLDAATLAARLAAASQDAD